MDNEYDQSKVAYETEPKEKNVDRTIPGWEKQFPGDKMPQENKWQKKGVSKKSTRKMFRGKEHR